MSDGFHVTEFWFDMVLNRTEFMEAFENFFSGGKAENIPVVPDAQPGYLLFHLHVPLGREGELQKFLDDYADKHNAGNKWSQASSYPFNPAC